MQHLLTNQKKTVAEFSGENEEELYRESNNKVDRINVLIKQLMELKDAINKCKRNRYYWESHFSVLSMNIWAGQIKYRELQKKEARIREAISKATKLAKFKQQELRSLKLERAEFSSGQWRNFQIKCADYKDNFVDAHMQYSIQNLSGNIEQYQKDYNKIQDELLIQSKELESLKMEHDSICLNSDGDTDEILIINILLRDIMVNNNNNMLHKIKSTQRTLKKLENKIKQKKAVLNNYYK
ncbi:uncharacterized protein LOC143348885 [Colletes latitarsis]|uniref:uncharacterized protein LOC143348885 n=1 Tax=Colletes latitarsis TaxID=2605962 RepID=UPI00403570DB